MDVIRRIFGRSFARARASNRAKDWPVPAQGFRFPGIARPRDAASPRGAEGESAGTALRNTTHPLRDLGWPVHAGEVPTRAAGAQGNPFVHFGHRGGHASGGGEHPTSEGRGNGRWTALGESVHAIQVTDGRLEARSDRLVGRARGAEIDGDTCCEPRATARGRGGRRRGTLAPDPSGRRRRLDGRSERAAQARSRGRPRSHASSRDDVGRPWRGPYERAATGLGVVQVRSGSAPVASRISA